MPVVDIASPLFVSCPTPTPTQAEDAVVVDMPNQESHDAHQSSSLETTSTTAADPLLNHSRLEDEQIDIDDQSASNRTTTAGDDPPAEPAADDDNPNDRFRTTALSFFRAWHLETGNDPMHPLSVPLALKRLRLENTPADRERLAKVYKEYVLVCKHRLCSNSHT